MPDSIKQIRDARGGLDNLSDEQIVKIGYGQYKNYYGNEEEYAKAVG